MGVADLQSLQGELSTIAANETVAASMPVATFVQEAFNLSKVVAEAEVRRALLDVGLDAERLDLLPRAVGALNEAETRWRATARRSVDDSHANNESAATALRSRVIQVAQFALRRDRLALGTLSAIQQGRGLDDLTADLAALAQLLDDHGDAFTTNLRFDRPTTTSELTRLHRALREGEQQQADPRDRTEAKVLRDRAFTFLWRLTIELREAAAVAFHDEPPMLKRFQSAYKLRKSRGRVPVLETAAAIDTKSS